MCYCGSKESFENCCDRYISKKELAPTPLALMKSRYSAFVIKDINHLMSTAAPEVHISHESLSEWAEQITWNKLEIINTSSKSETLGEVEFRASFVKDNKNKIQHERSYFKKKNDRWLYVAGELNPVVIKHIETKITRNDPCSCGSGKKYKKCCGK